MASIFLSHSHKDKSFARRLAADLRHNGHIVWIDEAEINVGDSLIEMIREGLDRVEFVAAILSRVSIKSEWVQRELDIASNREIDERRVIVLPILLEDVELPGFLKGKLYADFRSHDRYAESLELLLRALGPRQTPAVPAIEVENLKQDLEAAKQALARHQRDLKRHQSIIARTHSAKLQAEIKAEKKLNPHHTPVNEAYAFEVAGTPITLGYLLHAIGKAMQKGGHQLEILLTLEDKWDNVRLMLEAYEDLLEGSRGDG